MKQIFINLAVADVNKSMDFYTQLGFTNNPQFSDEQGKCMVWSEHIFVMLLSPDKFKTFTEQPLADTKKPIAGLMKDYGFMQQRSIEDFDGHTWEIFYMDMSKFPTA